MQNARRNTALAGILFMMLAQAVAKTPSPVSLTLTIETNSVKAESPVKVVVAVKNETQNPIVIAGETPEEIYKVDVRDNVGKPVPERERLHILVSLHEVKLAPGESHQDEILLSHMYDLSRPGTYLVMVGRNSRYEPEAGTENVRSNLLVINVTK